MSDPWGTTDDAWGTGNTSAGNGIPNDDPWSNPKGGDGGDGDGGDRACFNCGQTGHSKADCTEPRKAFDGTCNACGEQGHTRRDCPSAPAMTCRTCGEEGHMRKECPNKGPDLCRNCREEGHATVDCKSRRKIDFTNVADVDADKAWEEIHEAIQERDGVEAKESIQKYLKHYPEMGYVELENAFRAQEMNIYLIATERVLAPTHTNMDLQGNLDKKYTVQYRFSAQPDRQREKANWPASPEENLARLEDAGEPVSRLMQKCNNCNELGHNSKDCPQDPMEKARVTIACYNCGEEGHRVRDCPTPRIDKFACKNCGQSGHKVSDCTEPRKAGDDVECNKCHEITRIKCNNCGEMGHKSYKCPNPPKEDIDDFGASNAAPDNIDTGDAWGTGGGSTEDTGASGW
ncbi:zinc knuckle [Colletotrichum nymphaeae SA-01]|uniref:Zinc knuckle n=1 Tax=Colletotrichum nymphaeae SA-01 TaxID=1460502 RepID=A0A135USZ8_9PEZI|nr:zinc knuckle [Colletotrichum nymphaeae SA-01]